MQDKYRQADEALLASLGYKQEFRREFTPLEVFGIAFSIIGLLPSITSVLIYALPNGGPVAMVWGWAVASIGIFVVGLSMAELASAAPTSGGVTGFSVAHETTLLNGLSSQLYFWTHSLSSPRCRNLLAWIVGYSNTIGSIAAIASTDWGCAVQIAAAAAIGSGEEYSATDAETFGIYVAVVLTHGVLCSFGTKVLARLQGLYVVLNVLLCVAVIIALPAATPTKYKNSASYALGDFTNLNGWPNGYAFILSFLTPLWTICSLDSSVHISEEASNAAVAIPWAIVSAIGIAGVLGWAINIALAFCMGSDIQALLDSNVGQPMAQIFCQSFGRQGTLVVWSIVVVAQYMMGSSMVLVASRQAFAFSRDGALPFSSILYRMNRYTKAPVNTVWFCCITSILLGLLAFAGEQAIGAVFSLSVVGLYVAYAIPISARFVFENDHKPGSFDLGVWSLPVAVISVTWMTFVGIVFLFPATPGVGVGDMNYTVVVLGGVLIFSLVYYYFPKYGGKNWFTGPVRTVDVREGNHGICGDKEKENTTVEVVRTLQ